MFCVNCGSELPESALICPVCGTAADPGKQRCRILKEIRQRIADENDIPYVTRDCRYRGECAGTCPRCESELRYLEEELAKRERAGQKTRVAGLYSGPSSGSFPPERENGSDAEPDPFLMMTAGVPAGPFGPADTKSSEPPRPPELAGVPARPFGPAETKASEPPRPPELAGVPARPPRGSWLKRLWSRMPWSRGPRL